MSGHFPLTVSSLWDTEVLHSCEDLPDEAGWGRGSQSRRDSTA
jgi:hypothetical protein